MRCARWVSHQRASIIRPTSPSGRNCAPFVGAVAGGLEIIIVDQFVRTSMQRRTPRLLALPGDFEMRHAAPGLVEILDLEVAESPRRRAWNSNVRVRMLPAAYPSSHLRLLR